MILKNDPSYIPSLRKLHPLSSLARKISAAYVMTTLTSKLTQGSVYFTSEVHIELEYIPVSLPRPPILTWYHPTLNHWESCLTHICLSFLWLLMLTPLPSACLFVHLFKRVACSVYCFNVEALYVLNINALSKYTASPEFASLGDFAHEPLIPLRPSQGCELLQQSPSY